MFIYNYYLTIVALFDRVYKVIIIIILIMLVTLNTLAFLFAIPNINIIYIYIYIIIYIYTHTFIQTFMHMQRHTMIVDFSSCPISLTGVVIDMFRMSHCPFFVKNIVGMLVSSITYCTSVAS